MMWQTQTSWQVFLSHEGYSIHFFLSLNTEYIFQITCMCLIATHLFMPVFFARGQISTNDLRHVLSDVSYSLSAYTHDDTIYVQQTNIDKFIDTADLFCWTSTPILFDWLGAVSESM